MADRAEFRDITAIAPGPPVTANIRSEPRTYTCSCGVPPPVARYQNVRRDHPIWGGVRVDLCPLRPPLSDPAEELVDQLLEAIQLTPEVTVADLQAALARRSGARNYPATVA